MEWYELNEQEEYLSYQVKNNDIDQDKQEHECDVQNVFEFELTSQWTQKEHRTHEMKDDGSKNQQKVQRTSQNQLYHFLDQRKLGMGNLELVEATHLVQKFVKNHQNGYVLKMEICLMKNDITRDGNKFRFKMKYFVTFNPFG